MRLAFDARWINPEPSGIGIYARELLRRLPRLAPDLEFWVLFRDQTVRAETIAAADLAEAPNVRPACLPYGIFAPQGQLRLPLWLHAHKVRLYHSPNYLLPYAAFPRDRRGRIRAVTTIHDVIPFVVPNHAPRSRKTRLWPLFVTCMRQSVARADAVITVSEASRRDLIDALGLPLARAARIHRVYNGVHPAFTPAGAPRPRRPGAPRTILYVGRLDPYKNVEPLVRVFAQLQTQLELPLRLRIVGPPDPRYPEARRAAEALGVAEAVRFEGFLDEAGLVQAYQEADVLAHPSRYEGFGLQILEAMRCGLPVVCAAAGALPEVAGDAARLVPSDNAEALREALREVLCDDALAARLSTAGLARAQDFTWERAAAETLSIYRELLENVK